MIEKNKYSIRRTESWSYSIDSSFNWNETKNLEFNNLNEQEVYELFNEVISELEKTSDNYWINEIITLMSLKYELRNNSELDSFDEENEEFIYDENATDYKTKLYEIMNDIENWVLWWDKDQYKLIFWNLINSILSWNEDQKQKWIDLLYEDINEYKESWAEEYIQYVNMKLNFID